MTHLSSDAIRSLFSAAMSEMYRQEVPQYGTLIDLVRDVNDATLAANPALRAQISAADEMARLDVERHGAIRLGTPQELFLIRQMFAVMGLHPVGYYDLSVAGLPVHSTAFRPIDSAALRANPFRVFTSLIRLELLEDQDLAAQAAQILAKRDIITPRAKELIGIAQAQGGLNKEQAHDFVAQALETFRWHAHATVSADTYHRLHDAHRLIADVVSFAGPHINHLTPRTLDIDAVQRMMPERGITPKAVIEGPPKRSVDILLRQTSFKALEETIVFKGAAQSGTHTARFGEIEQRGVALKPAGRALYDRCLAQTRATAAVGAKGENADQYRATLEQIFAPMADDLLQMWREDLAFVHFRAGPRPADKMSDIDALIDAGHLLLDPQIYEDFLPVSAAGIFQSNLGSDAQSTFAQSANRDAFEAALGASVIDEMQLYQASETRSLNDALRALGQSHLLTTQDHYATT
ncbi:DUF1338 domain-containing protein [Thioclava sp. SK-1]|uniref:2-oxoadipate dioxygenase/decarboxylase HglS n=1 Tax=Thioclava sp. SK-1 TaxID=1889770 RepID=UPI0008241BCC|nr:VOC family protein [Thioclava sp. SK-1]OCX65971.1 DUF1338 domain-containing protein [Thioclava sp. SK-1]